MSLQQGTAGNRKQNGKPKMNKCEKVIFFSQQSAFCEQDLLDNDDNGFWYFDAWSVRFASAQSASI